jgi:microcystin-dependent protein
MQYFGKTDPDGWVICDGQPRTCTDNRYTDLAILLNSVLSVNTNNSNSITPPDLRSKFLYGASDTQSNIGNTTGSATRTLTTNELPSHTHTGTTGDDSPDHTHNGLLGGGSNVPGVFNIGATIAKYTGLTVTTTGASARHTHTFTTGSAGSGNAFSIIPPNVIINHIMKY